MTERTRFGVRTEARCPAIASPGAELVAIDQKTGYKWLQVVGP